MKKKVGLLTWHYNNNFGSTLQALAIQETIRALGFDTFFINYRKKEKIFEKYKNTIRIWRSYILEKMGRKDAERLRYGFLRFRKKYLKEGRVIYHAGKLENACKGCYAVVCGSDQIWAPNVFDSAYFLDFVPDGIKKVSYAASIGLPVIPDQYIPLYNELLSRLDYISVREKEGSTLLARQCDIKSETVLDPTLLLSVDEWFRYERKVLVPKSDFIFCYFLNANNSYNAIVKAYQEKIKAPVLCVSADIKNAEIADTMLRVIGPDDFLAMIHYAKFVITDSFHGTAFAINFEVPFASLPRFSDDDKICQNSRIYNLLSITHMNDRIIRSVDYAVKDRLEFDFALPKMKLNQEKKASLNYLAKALE